MRCNHFKCVIGPEKQLKESIRNIFQESYKAGKKKNNVSQFCAYNCSYFLKPDSKGGVVDKPRKNYLSKSSYFP